eukprot:542151_1
MSPMIVFMIMSMYITTSATALSFEEGNTNAPQVMEATAVGYDAATDTILLFGGSDVLKQFIKFKDHSFFDGVTSHLLRNVGGDGQSYTQLNNALHCIVPTNSGSSVIISIDVTTYNQLATTIAIPTYVSYAACLTSIDHYLIVIGGGTWVSTVAMDTVQIYNINTKQWLSNVPSLRTPRMSVSCIVVNDILYAIGGWQGDTPHTYLNTIETLDVSDMSSIQTQQWQYFGDTLNTARGGTRVVSRGSEIVVIGGQDNADVRVSDVHIIDTNSGQIYVGGQLAFGVSYAASIIVDSMLYVFGGYSATGAEKRYQYAIMPSSHPTTHPTTHPTSIPSINPTNNPSKNPTDDPSQYPTNIPSQYPTLDPSLYPTNDPITTTITLIPTWTPVVDPSNSATTSIYTASHESTRIQLGQTSGSESNIFMVLGVIVLVIVALSMCILSAIIYLYRANKTMQKNATQMQLSEMEHKDTNVGVKQMDRARREKELEPRQMQNVRKDHVNSGNAEEEESIDESSDSDGLYNNPKQETTVGASTNVGNDQMNVNVMDDAELMHGSANVECKDNNVITIGAGFEGNDHDLCDNNSHYDVTECGQSNNQTNGGQTNDGQTNDEQTNNGLTTTHM